MKRTKILGYLFLGVFLASGLCMFFGTEIDINKTTTFLGADESYSFLLFIPVVACELAWLFSFAKDYEVKE